jgi:hypothetical protein
LTAPRDTGKTIAMPRPRKPKTEIDEIEQKLAGVLKWAERQGFTNIATELRRCHDFVRALKKSQ